MNQTYFTSFGLGGISTMIAQAIVDPAERMNTHRAIIAGSNFKEVMRPPAPKLWTIMDRRKGYFAFRSGALVFCFKEMFQKSISPSWITPHHNGFTSVLLTSGLSGGCAGGAYFAIAYLMDAWQWKFKEIILSGREPSFKSWVTDNLNLVRRLPWRVLSSQYAVFTFGFSNAVTYRAVFFGVFDAMMHYSTNEAKVDQSESHFERIGKTSVASLASTSTATMLLLPLERAALASMRQEPHEGMMHRGVIDICRQIASEEGWSRLFHTGQRSFVLRTAAPSLSLVLYSELSRLCSQFH